MGTLAVALQELEHLAKECHTPRALANAVYDQLAGPLGAGDMSFVLGPSACVMPDCVVVRSTRLEPQLISQRLFDAYVMIEREVASFGALIRRGQLVFDLRELGTPDMLRRTTVYNEFWAPFGLEQQVVGLFADGPRFEGHVCFARPASEPEFERHHRDAITRVCEIVYRWTHRQQGISDEPSSADAFSWRATRCRRSLRPMEREACPPGSAGVARRA